MTSILYNQKFVKYFEIAIFLFGLFLLYQIILKIFGGSWQLESLIIGLLLVILGYVFKLSSNVTRVGSDLNHLNKQFQSLAIDFKKLDNDFRNHLTKKHKNV
jgi:hypothetical protein